MTGPEHYQRAEELLDEATSSPPGKRRMDEAAGSVRTNRLAEAQVHSTLALAAASAGARSEWEAVLYPDRSTP